MDFSLKCSFLSQVAKLLRAVRAYHRLPHAETYDKYSKADIEELLELGQDTTVENIMCYSKDMIEIAECLEEYAKDLKDIANGMLSCESMISEYQSTKVPTYNDKFYKTYPTLEDKGQVDEWQRAYIKKSTIDYSIAGDNQSLANI